MSTHKQEREQKRLEAKVQEELRRRSVFRIKTSVLAVRQVLRQLGRS